MKIMKRIYQFLLLAAGCAALTTACSDDDDSYLVRETDSIRFASCLASSKQITLPVSYTHLTLPTIRLV